ncbi:MAG: urease accessory protein UreE [Clostridia bacterium]
MVVDKILGNINEITTEKSVININFEWFELEKKRISKVAEDGTTFGVCIEKMLADGDILAETVDTIYTCNITPRELIKIYVETMEEMGRLCFELGNRHLSLKISSDNVCVPFDEPTFEYLKKLGFHAHKVVEKFTSFTECKAHGASNHVHTHSHGEHSHTH